MLKLYSAFLLMLISYSVTSQDFEVYVCDAGGFDEGPWQIVSYNSMRENPTVFIDTELGWPTDIIFLEDQGVVLVSNLLTGRITKYDILTGEYIDDFANGIMNGPARMRMGPDSLIYISKFSGNRLMERYALDGTPVDTFTNVPITECFGFDWDAEGNLYMASSTDNTIRQFDVEGNYIGEFIDPDDISWPVNIWFGENGGLFVLDY